MGGIAKQLRLSVSAKPSPRAERRIIVLNRKKDYGRCLRELRAAGIKPVKATGSIRMICCLADRRIGWGHLRRHPRVSYVERDKKVKANGHSGKRAPCPSRTPWNVCRVKAPPAWVATAGRGVKVGIIDTGIAKHPDLTIAGGVNTLGGRTYADDNGHGTHVAGIVAATGRKRLFGVAPGVRLYAVKALDKKGSGYISDIVQGIDWCLNRGIRVMNMSFGMPDDSRALKDAIARARRRGAVIVASAGNEGKRYKRLDVPARYPQTLAVAALTKKNRVASFSSRGRGLDLSAPGVGILSTWPKGKYRKESGTSMAAPHVTGCAALLRSVYPGIAASQVAKRLKARTRRLPGGASAVGSGLVQAASSVL